MDRLRRIPRWLIPVMIVEATLKLIAAIQAARNRQYTWCVALILVNSAGVLPVLYLWRFQKRASALS